DAITLAMEEVAAGNADLAQRTEEQAAALQQTSATMAGLRDAIQRTASDAKSAAFCADDAFSTVRRGSQEVVAVATTMERITESSNEIADILNM
ncbi:methyl-accepting chemotaxis protein, partial [Escherichia coli]|nr:methyl-accepting chemotaxis protein [Escherichia coli]